MEGFFKELSKHYLNIAAAILIVLLIALVVKEPGINLLRITIGAILYFLLILFSILLYRLSTKIKKTNGDENI
jgi:cobalamin synthase